jgi:hypothetical protein
MSDPQIAAILTWRGPSSAGVEVHAREFVDILEAERLAPHYAEIYGSCRIHYVRASGIVLHSRAVPHDAKVRDPEVIR